MAEGRENKCEEDMVLHDGYMRRSHAFDIRGRKEGNKKAMARLRREIKDAARYQEAETDTTMNPLAKVDSPTATHLNSGAAQSRVATDHDASYEQPEPQRELRAPTHGTGMLENLRSLYSVY